MFLENVVFDAVDPQRLGRFWEAAVQGERLTDQPDVFETRVAVQGGPALDLCFQPVPDPPTGLPRLDLVLAGGSRQVERLLALGARELDVSAGDRALLADPEGGRFRIVTDPAADPDRGALSALRLQSADPGGDAQFWSWLTGWIAIAPQSLRHPSGRGPVLEFGPEVLGKGETKNRRHLDVRLETGDDPDAVAAGIVERGGSRLPEQWGELPWTSYTDPSGNELCLLPARP